MQLTGKQIVSRRIVTNVCEEGIQQQGVDVRLKDIYKVSDDDFGTVPAAGKTRKPNYEKLEADENGMYVLPEGWYEVDLEEGCNIGSEEVLNFKTRSSLVRCGAIIHSGQFDAGFHTDNMGCFLQVVHPIELEKGARIAQATVYQSYEVENENMYNGQWQGDKQRNETAV